MIDPKTLAAADIDVLEILGRVSLFEGLKNNHEALEHICQIMKVRELKAEQRVINEGEVGDELFVLIVGQVSIYRKTPDGDSYKVAILSAEMTPAFGEGGLIATEARTASVLCDIPCRFLVLNRAQFEEFAQNRPDWAIHILRKIAIIILGRLKQVNHDLVLLHRALMHEIRG